MIHHNASSLRWNVLTVLIAGGLVAAAALLSIGWSWLGGAIERRTVAAPADRLAAAAERIAKALEHDEPAEHPPGPRAAVELAGSNAWSLMLVEERGGCTATLFIDGHSHHGHGATRDEAEAAALEAWHAATGGPRA